MLAVAARHWWATHTYRSGLWTPLPAALQVVTIEARRILLSVSGGGCLYRRHRCAAAAAVSPTDPAEAPSTAAATDAARVASMLRMQVRPVNY